MKDVVYTCDLCDKETKNKDWDRIPPQRQKLNIYWGTWDNYYYLLCDSCRIEQKTTTQKVLELLKIRKIK